jgi:hypothetical protein
MAYLKARFTNGTQRTSGVFDADTLHAMTLSQLAKSFPSDSTQVTVELSPEFSSHKDAKKYQFPQT